MRIFIFFSMLNGVDFFLLRLFFLICTGDLYKAIKNNAAPSKEINEKKEGILKNELESKMKKKT